MHFQKKWKINCCLIKTVQGFSAQFALHVDCLPATKACLRVSRTWNTFKCLQILTFHTKVSFYRDSIVNSFDSSLKNKLRGTLSFHEKLFLVIQTNSMLPWGHRSREGCWLWYFSNYKPTQIEFYWSTLVLVSLDLTGTWKWQQTATRLYRKTDLEGKTKLTSLSVD